MSETYEVKADAKAISNIIDNLSRGCKPSSVIRELVKNGWEAAQRKGVSEESPGIVRIARDNQYPHKAVIANTAGDPLTRAVAKNSLASIGNTGNNPEDNFGIGAKISYLPSHPEGLLYRSREEKVAFTFYKDPQNIYGFKLEKFEDGDCAHFIECSEEEFRFPDSETEVALMGKTPQDDSWLELCKVASKTGDEDAFTGWTIFDHLNARFWEAPPHCEAEIYLYDEEGNHTQIAKCSFLKKIKESKEVHGTVHVDKGTYVGTKIHYYAQDVNRGKKKGTRDIAGYFGYIHNGEVFIQKDIAAFARKRRMENAGILVSHKNVLILAELPESMNLRARADRSDVVNEAGTSVDDMLEAIANEFRNRMPDNLKSWMSSNFKEPNSDVTKEAEKIYKKQSSSSGAANAASRGTGAQGGSTGSSPGTGTGSGTNKGSTGTGKKRKRKPQSGTSTKSNGSAPAFKMAPEGADEPLASFPLSAYTITINTENPVFKSLVDTFETEFAGAPLEQAIAEELYLQICYWHATLLQAYGASESEDKIEARMEDDRLDAVGSPLSHPGIKKRLEKYVKQHEREEALLLDED